MNIVEQLLSALTQVGAVLILSGIFYGINRLFRKHTDFSFLDYIGVQPARKQFDRKFLVIWLAVVVFAVVSTLLEYRFSNDFRQMLMNEHSPYGVILNGGFSMTAVVLGLVYCFLKAGGSEEILFRGLIARRLFRALGFHKGNVVQALIFWFMHLGIFRLVTGEWISFVQFLAFITSFGLGLVLGYVNFRKGGASIAPSWLIHGSVNFITFLTLAVLWKK